MTEKEPPELVQFCNWLNKKPSEKVRPLEDDRFEDKLWVIIQAFIEDQKGGEQ